jgi:hypothetical protein
MVVVASEFVMNGCTTSTHFANGLYLMGIHQLSRLIASTTIWGIFLRIVDGLHQKNNATTEALLCCSIITEQRKP